ncbi:capsid assembly and DNA maturation protein-like protein [Vombatid gammaherpesvirus 1]|uniref:Capsid assembly and DNA maturation protein-like protein n=1 Tax=Vombatid gammaherpesvirus 1 TaxID=2052651 RepID=A0A3S5HA10_9GAMA|nr:capsid assembly and DNA maturation protein-like protein [Vombatid gammaherpesvirus 1]AZB49161.1 capsid assembly and DNA maturation protein-like protein [Vombatid gammaherpesvirus 1]
MKVKAMVDSESYTHMTSDILRLLPPQPHKYSINDKLGLYRATDNLASKSSTSLSIATIRASLVTIPYIQPQYSDFLVNCKILNDHEPVGSFLMRLIDEDDDRTLITFAGSPTFLSNLLHYEAETFPQLHRLSNIWYSDYISDESIETPLSKVREAIEGRYLHKLLHPLGLMVSNTQSTFMNKIRVITHGPALSQVPIKHVKLLLPQEMFTDLEQMFPIHTHSTLSTRNSTSKLYAVLIYTKTLAGTRAELKFLSTNRGAHETTSLIYQLYKQQIVSHISSLVDEDSINKIVFGAICYLGFAVSDRPADTETFTFKVTPVRYIAVHNFTVEPGDWRLLL